MDELEIRYKLRHKENKTQEDKLLLKYYEQLFLISEILVEESKQHISPEKAIRDIRSVF